MRPAGLEPATPGLEGQSRNVEPASAQSLAAGAMPCCHAEHQHLAAGRPTERILSGMTEEEAKRALDKLLDVSWKSVGAAGWNRYQLHGRGALLASIHMLDGRSDSM